MKRIGPVLLIVAAGAAAQTTVLVASEVDALWADGDVLIVQTDRRIHRLSPGDDGTPRAASADGTLTPELASFFDVRDGRTLWVGARLWGSAVGETPLFAADAPFLRRPTGGAPVRLPLLLGNGGFVAPARPEFVCRWPGGNPETERIDVPLHGALELGWGAGDPLEVDLVVPHLLPRRHAGGLDLVVGIGARWTRHRAKGSVALEPPPVDGEDGILDFPFTVPPVCEDLDGDGDDDLALVDPSAGVVALYTDLDAPRPAPTRVILVNGLCLAAWVGDYDADGRSDLVLLRARKPGLAGQLKVLQQGLLSSEALLYAGQADGGLSTSPRARRKLDVGIRIGIRNEVREAVFTSACLPGPGPALLVAHPDGTLDRLPIGEGDATTVGKIPAGGAIDAFRAVTVGGGVAFGWRTASDARVVWLKDA